MKRITALLIVVLPLFAHPAFAFNNNPPVELGAQICYGYAMVGFDSVINSRVGVPAEYALGLAAKNPLAANADASYSTQVLKIVLDAYLWPDNPHDYAVQVFYHCAKEQGAHLDTNLY
jgi:hypothetical protein